SRPAYHLTGGSAMTQDLTDTGARSTPRAARCVSWMAPSRRGLIRASAGFAAGAAAQLLVDNVAAAGGSATLDQLTRVERDPNHRILLRGGIVLSLDSGVGDFETGDVLIGGKKILAIGRNLNATGLVVDAAGMIVMPGFVDTHHHQYET